jgi:glycosyltransferase involved in cell wall biosynthesis
MSDALIVVTPALKTSIAQHVGSKPIYVIPNGANTELFHPGAGASAPVMAGPISCDGERPGDLGTYALFFGALAQWQGIETLLQAKEDPLWPSDVSLVIAGEGAMRPQIEKAANLCRRVIYLGKVPYHEMPGVIARSLVTISPQTNLLNRSSTGLFPLKVFESLSCGIPVVATDFPGQADLIRAHRCGVVIPAEDPTSLARAVAYFYEHPEDRNRMGERGHNAVLRHHSWDLAAEHTAQVLAAVLKGRQPCLPAGGEGVAQ